MRKTDLILVNTFFFCTFSLFELQKLHYMNKNVSVLELDFWEFAMYNGTYQLGGEISMILDFSQNGLTVVFEINED